MRNLQKILALVLALVMSLSLMAAAGARDFTDGDQIDETFAESVDVLTGLEVFQGYPSGDFQPKGDITRAEVAAIIYRIATGDVTDSQVGIYADYNKFSDVPSDNWAAGYINYCANAEYIKGRGDGKFYPQDKVTGYEALAMILRVVGYDKNGEFTGADWQVQTAATANQRKVTKNVNAGTLGQPASRETVAELLCQAILINKVNYTLAFGYQESDKTIAYETFKMEKLEGVVTGNEVADLKESSPLSAGQTRLVIDGREEIVDIPTTLDKIGKSVRAYIRPQGGTTRKQLVTADVYDTELNHVYDSFAPVSSVGNSTGSEQGINSIKDAQHFINYDFVNRWTASIRITYIMDVKWTDYDAYTMRRDNGGRLFAYPAGGRDADSMDPSKPGIALSSVGSADTWSTQLKTDAPYTFTYTKTIELDKELTQADYNNLYSIFQKGDRVTSVGSWINGEVYVGTASYDTKDDISDDIRWGDFTNTYLVNKDNRAQVESNGRGNRLIIIDNNDDGIAEYVLQTIYTIGKVSSDAKHVDTLNQKLYDSSNSDAVNSTVTSNTLVPVSGKDLAKTEEYTPAAGDVVIFALIDGNIRAQKAETKTEKVNTVNRAAKTITVVGEDAATYYESAVHTHSQNMAFGVNGMAGNTTYTMYFDLDGNMAAYTEGANGGLVLITNGWHRSAIGGSEYAVQAYLDNQLQTVEVGASGAQFINRNSSNNQWGNLRGDFGNGTINNENQAARNNGIHTIIANLDGNNLTPVDLAYFYSQKLRVLDMVGNVAPDMNNVQTSWGVPYETVGEPGNLYSAYNRPDNATDKGARTDGDYNGSYEVRGLSNTVFYVVYKGIGTDTMTNDRNVVVRSYTGGAPSIPAKEIEDVYAVGAKAVNANGNTYYTAQMVVIEVGSEYNKLSEQVFIPEFPVVGGNVQLEEVTMIDSKGEKVTRTVDMYNSWTYDWYNTALGTTGGHAGLRQPGLYFIDPSDTNPEVYVVKKMSPEDIRDNNYLVGFVNESRSGSQGTLNSRYPQIELKVRPNMDDSWVETFNSANASALFPKNPGEVNANNNIGTGEYDDLNKKFVGKNVTDNSKLYLYNGTAASLTEDSDYNVFSQNRHSNAGTNVSALNERWVPGSNNPAQFTNPNRNEVLVRYSGNNIVWAVSFNETEAAQRVWWNSLPWDADNVAEADVTFWGDNTPDVTGGTTITVPFSATKNNKGLSVNAKDGVYALVEVGSNGAILQQPTAKTEGATYTLTFTDNFGDPQVWTLVQERAHNDAGLTYTDAAGVMKGVAIAEKPGTKDTYTDDKISISDFEKRFASTGTNASAPEFEWKYGDGTTPTDKGTLLDNKMTCVITVKAEDGTERFVTYKFEAPTNSMLGALNTLNALKTDTTLSDDAADNVAIDLYYDANNTQKCFFRSAAQVVTDSAVTGCATELDTTVQNLTNTVLTTASHSNYVVTAVAYNDPSDGSTNAGGAKNMKLDGEYRNVVCTLTVQNKNGSPESETVTLNVRIHYVDKAARTVKNSLETATDTTPLTLYYVVNTTASPATTKIYTTEAGAPPTYGGNGGNGWDTTAEEAYTETAGKSAISSLVKTWLSTNGNAYTTSAGQMTANMLVASADTTDGSGRTVKHLTLEIPLLKNTAAKEATGVTVTVKLTVTEVRI